MSERIQATDAEKAELLEPLLDPVWRLNNLYRIVDKFGRDIPFVPNAQQAQIIDAVYNQGQRRHAILKARQIGFSTLIEIIILDACYFGENITASIIDQTAASATAKLKEKCGFAYMAIGPLRERLTEDNNKSMAWANGSRISAGLRARGGTNQILHVSEWGPIAHDDPPRSEEIKTGALPSADQGLIFVETTFKGGKGGHLYDLLKTAMETPAEHRTAKDFRFWFFPWYSEPSYTLEGDARRVPAEIGAYLDTKEADLGIRFTPGQRLWYAKTKQEQGIFMFREYPTTVEEAMSAPVEGSIYGDLITQLRAKGRIIPFERNRACPVFAAWDLGWDDSTSIWLIQQVGLDFHVIWHTRQRQRTAADMAQILYSSGIQVAAHYIPHDGGHKRPGEGKNYKDSMLEAGLQNITVVPVVPSIWDGINFVREILPRCYINPATCGQGIESLEAYHTKDTSSGGTISKEPVHDWSSHDCDGFRTFAEALKMGLVSTRAAQRFLDVAPRYPDGSLVAPDHVDQLRRVRRSSGLAKSGPTPFGP